MAFSTEGLTFLDSIPQIPRSDLGLSNNHPDWKFSKCVRLKISRGNSGDIVTTLVVL